MKICNNCGTKLDDYVGICPECGTVTESMANMADENKKEVKLVRGILGAFLFSLAGVAAYVVMYMVGYISLVSVCVMFAVANIGYKKFSGESEGSIKGLLVAAAVTIIMIPISECICLGVEIYQAYSDTGINIIDAMYNVPDFLTDEEIRSACIEDIVFSYIVGALWAAWGFIDVLRNRK